MKQGMRAERLGEALRSELSELIRERVKDPRVAKAGASISQVRVAGDGSHAKVLVSFLGDEQLIEPALEALAKVAGFLRGEAGRRLNLRHAPTLVFEHDRTAEDLDRINKILIEDKKRGEDK